MRDRVAVGLDGPRMSPASSWAMLGIVLVALPACVVMLLAILADLGRPVVCEDGEWGALLDAVEAAREDFPDHLGRRGRRNG